MKIFELKNTVPIITEDGMMVPEFKTLYEQEEVGFKKLQFVYFSTDYKSFYLNVPEDTREKELVKDFIGIPGWKPDVDVKKAIEKYKLLQKTESLGLLEDARYALEKIRGYYKSIDFSKRDTKGNQVFKITDVTRSIGDISKMIESLEKLKEKVIKEEELNSKVRGGSQGGYFEDQ